MSDAKFCIYMDKDGDIANIRLDINASHNDIANMFNTLCEAHSYLIPCILDGIMKSLEDKTLN